MRTLLITAALTACSPEHHEADHADPSEEVPAVSPLDGPLPPPVACLPSEVARIGPRAFSTAQQAVDAAADGDVVTLCRGTIVGGLDVNTYASLAIVGETGDANDVIIDASPTGWGIWHAGQFGRVTLGGFTVINAQGRIGALAITKEQIRIHRVNVRDSDLEYFVFTLYGHQALVEDVQIDKVVTNIVFQTDMHIAYSSSSPTRPELRVRNLSVRNTELDIAFYNLKWPHQDGRNLPNVIIEGSTWEDNTSDDYLLTAVEEGIARFVVQDSLFARNTSTSGFASGSWTSTLTILRSTFLDNVVDSDLFGNGFEGVQIADSTFHRNRGRTIGFFIGVDRYRLRDVDFGAGADDNYPNEMRYPCPPLDYVAYHSTTTGACPP